MEAIEPTGKLTPKDRRALRVWTIAPWLALVLISVVPPAAVGILALLLGGAPLWLLAGIAIPISMIVAIITTIVLLVMRRNWVKRVRERLA